MKFILEAVSKISSNTVRFYPPKPYSSLHVAMRGAAKEDHPTGLFTKWLLALLILLSSSGALAQSGPNPTADEIFSSVMSPYCAGRLLRDCPSSKAAELKDKMRTDLNSGKSKEAVLQEFYSTYGEAYRASPKGSGFGLLGWVAPALFVAVGGILIYGWIAANRRSAEVESPAGAQTLPQSDTPRPLTDEMKARIEKELNS